MVELAGDVGYKLHTGRSRNEQIATDLRLYVRDQIDAISQLLVEFVGEFVKQTEVAGENAMPAYTHLQRAEPVLVAHWLLAYVEMFLRDLDRLADCRKRMNECPLGSAAVAGTILPLDRETIAAELQFDSPTANSIDATSDRDFAIEFVQTLSFVAVASEPLGRGVDSVLDHRVWLREGAGAVSRPAAVPCHRRRIRTRWN